MYRAGMWKWISQGKTQAPGVPHPEELAVLCLGVSWGTGVVE